MEVNEKPKFNYAYLRGFIKEHFQTQAKFADFLGISQTTMYDRLNHKSPFTQDEIYRVANFATDRPLEPSEIDLLFFNV